MKGVHYLLAVFGTFLLGWTGIVLMPEAQIGYLQPQVDEDSGEAYPVNIGGVFNQGRQVYASEGCFYCHSQQVRDAHLGTDIARGWGTRPTVARDYIYESPVFLGTTRNGPDLANIGARQQFQQSNDPQPYDPKSAEWEYRHLYNPRSVTPGSIMPPFRFLFEKRRITGQASPDALHLTGEDAVEEGYEIVPTADARALVSYLLLLDHSHPLKEMKSTPEAPAK